MSRTAVLAALAAVVVAVAAAAPLLAPRPIPLSTLWDAGDDMAAKILWQIRLPRVAIGLLAGAALAVSGMVFQAVFRNALATPFTLGVASGASLGASLYIHLGLSFSVLWVDGSSWFAFAGAVGTIALVYGLTRARRGFSTATMLLAGVAISFFFSSLILFLQYLSDFTQSFVILRWLMGGLDRTVGGQDLLTLTPFVVAGTAVVAYFTNELNLLSTGEELAMSRGVEVNATKIALFLAVSLMVGAVVAICGPIGFVGLMVPHICRLIVGPDHRYLTPATLLFGAAFLAVCDALARAVIAPVELPVGILTSLLGGPFFLWLLLSGSTEDR
jgi:iron complex transport system permease protein